jgi:hypothetical protein
MDGGTFLPLIFNGPLFFNGQLMSIREFFNIYRVQAYTDGTIAFKSRGSSLFIYLHPTLLSNKVWRNEYFFVSGAWECPPTETLTEEQRILRHWSVPRAEGLFFFGYISVSNSRFFEFKILDINSLFLISFVSALSITPPDLSKAEADRVATILHFAHNINNVNEIDFYHLVTSANMKKYFGYDIPDQKPLRRGQVKNSFKRKTTQAEKIRTERGKPEKSKAGKGKTEKKKTENKAEKPES